MGWEKRSLVPSRRGLAASGPHLARKLLLLPVVPWSPTVARAYACNFYMGARSSWQRQRQASQSRVKRVRERPGSGSRGEPLLPLSGRRGTVDADADAASRWQGRTPPQPPPVAPVPRTPRRAHRRPRRALVLPPLLPTLLSLSLSANPLVCPLARPAFHWHHFAACFIFLFQESAVSLFCSGLRNLVYV